MAAKVVGGEVMYSDGVVSRGHQVTVTNDMLVAKLLAGLGASVTVDAEVIASGLLTLGTQLDRIIDLLELLAVQDVG